ncbi:MAG: TonB-dependent receptor [Betaproteobacteria bacterium HGW-Betaproteobacteria-11]|nr:MAG: TonB-dependent receptor [Betaproteobacteria bacterium HGW-Betaproteobacteria-11]
MTRANMPRLLTVAAALQAVLAVNAFAADETLLPPVTVTAAKGAESQLNAASADTLQTLPAATSDTASLLRDVPGVNLYGAGGVSSLPAIHGLADDRLRIKVDGMDLVSSCPNHMNSPLSYVDPSNIGVLKVYAGITPVSLGGDSIGGTVVAETPVPEFAAPGAGNLIKGRIGAFYRSNNNARGGNLGATWANETLSVTYSGATSQADNYTAGKDFKPTTATGRPGHTLPLDEVGSTAYKTENHTLGFALKNANHLFEARFGYQDIPYELYPNQRMDLLGNTQHRLNMRYLGAFDWGTLEARAYHEKVAHFMEFGADKQFLYTAGNTTQGMPMRTEGKTTGASVKADIVLAKNDLFRVGGEYQHYRLNDWWPAVVGSMGMGPNDFLNINDGQRDRTALFGEWEKKLSPQWLTLLGLRYEQVKTDAGMVHGYNLATFPTSGAGGMMNQTRDAVNLNTSNRDKTDNNWDLTALARYTPNTTQDIEFGFARKVRSPNLYERYSWSTANMMGIMNNFVGDGNGYVGDVNLKPEKAHTLSATFDWHAADHGWEFKATPYYTRVTDYIDAIQWNGTTNASRTPLVTNQFTVLKFVNQSARLYGLDLSGRLPLGKTGWGEWGMKGLLNYTNGKNRSTGDDLYNIMPLNAKLTLTQKYGAWDNGIELVMVKDKNKVSDMRNEIKTPGYSLVNLRASYSWQKARVDFGVENLFDKHYYLPLGGAYTGQGRTMGINSIPYGIAVPGMGRSLYAGVQYKF